jgi:hypothetical protein
MRAVTIIASYQAHPSAQITSQEVSSCIKVIFPNFFIVEIVRQGGF